MGEILKFPTEPSKFGYKRVRKRKAAENSSQLQLFSEPAAPLLSFATSSFFEQALILDERGDINAAELYAKAIESQDCVADAYCNLGIIESQSENLARAFDYFTTALKLDPRHSEAHYNLGNLYFELNDFRLAQIHYEMAAEVEPSFANVHFNLSLVQSILGDFAAAINSLSKYQSLVSSTESRHADELLQSLKHSLGVQKGTGGSA